MYHCLGLVLINRDAWDWRRCEVSYFLCNSEQPRLTGILIAISEGFRIWVRSSWDLEIQCFEPLS